MIEKEKQNEKYDPEKLCAKELLALTFHPDKKIFKIAGHTLTHGFHRWSLSLVWGKENVVWTKGIEQKRTKRLTNFFLFFYWTLSTNYWLIQGTCRAGLNKNLCSTWSLTEIDFSIQFLFKTWNSNTNYWHATTVIHISALLNALSWWWYERQLIKVKVKNIKKQDFAIVLKTWGTLSRFMWI